MEGREFDVFLHSVGTISHSEAQEISHDSLNWLETKFTDDMACSEVGQFGGYMLRLTKIKRLIFFDVNMKYPIKITARNIKKTTTTRCLGEGRDSSVMEDQGIPALSFQVHVGIPRPSCSSWSPVSQHEFTPDAITLVLATSFFDSQNSKVYVLSIHYGNWFMCQLNHVWIRDHPLPW